MVNPLSAFALRVYTEAGQGHGGIPGYRGTPARGAPLVCESVYVRVRLSVCVVCEMCVSMCVCWVVCVRACKCVCECVRVCKCVLCCVVCVCMCVCVCEPQRRGTRKSR